MRNEKVGGVKEGTIYTTQGSGGKIRSPEVFLISFFMLQN